MDNIFSIIRELDLEEKINLDIYIIAHIRGFFVTSALLQPTATIKKKAIKT